MNYIRNSLILTMYIMKKNWKIFIILSIIQIFTLLFSMNNNFQDYIWIFFLLTFTYQVNILKELHKEKIPNLSLKNIFKYIHIFIGAFLLMSFLLILIFAYVFLIGLIDYYKVPTAPVFINKAFIITSILLFFLSPVFLTLYGKILIKSQNFKSVFSLFFKEKFTPTDSSIYLYSFIILFFLSIITLLYMFLFSYLTGLNNVFLIKLILTICVFILSIFLFNLLVVYTSVSAYYSYKIFEGKINKLEVDTFKDVII